MLVTTFPGGSGNRALLIPLEDGTRWLRASGCRWSRTAPVPAILEYLPTESATGPTSGIRCRIPTRRSWLCVCACRHARLGESDGLALGRILKQEQDDGWRLSRGSPPNLGAPARSVWSGISWGGFNGLQVAARRPPALKAIITLCSTDDRYADDTHFMGGALAPAEPMGLDLLPRRAAGPGARRRAMARDVAGANGEHCRCSSRAGLSTSGVTLLEARLGVRGLGSDPVPCLRRRRLGRWLYERDSAPARWIEGADQGPDRSLGARLSAYRLPGPQIGFLQEVVALVGPMAQGHRRPA